MVDTYRAKFKAPEGHTLNIMFRYNSYLMDNCPIEVMARNGLTSKLKKEGSEYKLMSITECR